MSLPAGAEALLHEDLSKSGLVPQDLAAYVAREPELAAIGMRPHMHLDVPGVHSPGYVIPYYDIHGARAPFYRVKLFKPLPKGAKYLQPKDTGSYVYFPTTFPELLTKTLAGKAKGNINGFDPCLIITEGEKKAAKACSEGFLAVGLGGVYSWRTRIVVFPEGTKVFKAQNNEVVAKLDHGEISPATSDRRAVLAGGLPAIIQLARDKKLQIILAFDSDVPENPQVQKACAELAFEIRSAGIPVDHIRQLRLPVGDKKKIGLDDFLVERGPTALVSSLHEVLAAKNAYPKHPDLKGLINSRLEAQITRSEARELALLVLSDMDTHGQRVIESGTDTPYYFDGKSKTLMSVNLLHHSNTPLHESKFGSYLYNGYDISQADIRVLNWIAAGFTGEQPCTVVQPRSVIALMDNNRIALQLSDSNFAIVSGDPKDPIKIQDNGTDGLLFRANQVEPIEQGKLLVEFQKQIQWIPTAGYENLYWPSALKQFKYVNPRDRDVLAVLCYMSPWLLRWNGAQLPVELMIGEPGSGKSSCYNLRLRILTGRPALRNQPTDIRDWYASITSQDGLFVTDNLHFATKEIRQRLSDEICRIVTEPQPHVELRKLFTTSDVARMPVRTTFAMTAIQQPFINADILQRSLIIRLNAVGDNHSQDWAQEQIDRVGSREKWLAHQLAVLHLFLKEANHNKGWKSDHKSSHRLANFEQMFQIIGKIIKVPDLDGLLKGLVNVAEDQVSMYDWTMQALKEFAELHLPSLQKDPKKVVTCADVEAWASAKEDYTDNQVITNARRLSRYMESHKTMIEKCSGIYCLNVKVNNRMAYRIKHLG